MATTLIVKLTKPKPTLVYKTYWRFAVERQNIFFEKIAGNSNCTDDDILKKHKFTNAYRASDRVSQYLIRNVIYNGSQEIDEVFFRIIVFKLFNKIETWEYLLLHLGEIEYKKYSFRSYNNVLNSLFNKGVSVYSGAYIMASGKSSFGYERKFQNHLRLIEMMMEEGLPERVAHSRNMEDIFSALKEFPTIGKFLAYQFAIDINYSEITSFSEMDFVMPGPGALDGIRKCFYDIGDYSAQDIVRYVTENQHKEFERLGLIFKSLWGRPLQLIDCQNLFCEVDKYARIAHPDFAGISGRIRIKQIYRPKSEPIHYWYPPKWGLNKKIKLK